MRGRQDILAVRLLAGGTQADTLVLETQRAQLDPLELLHGIRESQAALAALGSADALAGPELTARTLATRMREALELLQPFDADEKINARITDKLTEARMEYEALRTKLV